MTPEENALMIPLYGLFYIDDVTAFDGLTEETLDKWKALYSEDEMNGIYDGVRWAIAHPDHDFYSILSGLRHSNEDIYLFFCKLGKSMGIA